MLELRFAIDELRREKSQGDRVATLRNALEVDLLAIRNVHDGAAATSGGGTMMATYCRELVSELRRTLETTAASNEIYVDETHLFLSNAVLDQFRGDKHDAVWVVHKLWENDALLRAHELEWLRKVDERARSKRISRVHRLFIYRDESDLEDPISRALLAAHARDRRYDRRLLREHQYRELIQDHRVPEEVVDFGIYGPYCVFRGLDYGGGRLRGSYALEPGEVRRYRTAFESCWDSNLAQAAPVSAHREEGQPRSMQEFLARASRMLPSSPQLEGLNTTSST